MGFSLLILAAITAVFAIVWRSEPAAVPHSSPFTTIKAFSVEDRVPPNFVRTPTETKLLWSESVLTFDGMGCCVVLCLFVCDRRKLCSC